jgi:uroporphyrin-III C-methyltransferase
MRWRDAAFGNDMNSPIDLHPAQLKPIERREGPSTSLRTGRVVFVGAGPGSADLITVRGARMLGEADVVLFDALTDPSLRDLAPAARWINVGKRGYDHGTAQAHINALLIAHARRGLTVVRLKGGDPSIFGRLEEELSVLQIEGVICEIVPGVTAALAAAAQTLRPLTRRGRGRSLSLHTAVTREGAAVPPHARPKPCDTEVYYMAGHQLSQLSGTLLAVGWDADAPVCVVSKAGTPDVIISQHTVTSLADAALPHQGRPTIVTVGVGATSVIHTTDVRHAAQRAGAPLTPPGPSPLTANLNA